MIKILTKKVQLTFIFAFGLYFYSYAQERKIIPLNEHFFPIEDGGGNQQFYKIVRTSKEGILIEKIYTLENSLVSVKRSSFLNSSQEEPNIEQEHKYSPDGELEYIRIEYKEQSSSNTKVVVGEEIILDVNCINQLDCIGIYITPTGEEEAVDRDIFKPNFKSMEMWKKILKKNLIYPVYARRARIQGEVWVGMKISDSGELMERAIMNSNTADNILIKEVERILKKYDNGFVPAINLKGESITAWMYFPVRFVLN